MGISAGLFLGLALGVDEHVAKAGVSGCNASVFGFEDLARDHALDLVFHALLGDGAHHRAFDRRTKGAPEDSLATSLFDLLQEIALVPGGVARETIEVLDQDVLGALSYKDFLQQSAERRTVSKFEARVALVGVNHVPGDFERRDAAFRHACLGHFVDVQELARQAGASFLRLVFAGDAHVGISRLAVHGANVAAALADLVELGLQVDLVVVQFGLRATFRPFW